MIKPDQAIMRAVQVINGGPDRYHKWYDRTVKLAKFLSQLITGEGLDELLKQFVKREDDEAFKQRVAITQHIQPAVSKNLIDVSRKVPRSNGMKRVLTFTDDKNEEGANKRLTDFQNILNNFWGTQSFDKYLANRFIDLGYIDPNAFVVFEWKPFDNTKTRLQPFPFEVFSHMAIDYLYMNKVLQYLLVKTDTTPFLEKDTSLRYTLYLKNQTLTFDLLDTRKADEEDEAFLERVAKEFSIPVPLEDIKIDTNQKGEKEFIVLMENDDIYKVVFLVPHNLEQVPAIQVGFNPDLYVSTKGGTMFRNPFDAAIPYMMKMIKTVSELDLTMSLHAMPQKISYQNPCTNCKGSGQNNDGQCPDCKGMGYQIVSSANDAITIKLPHSATSENILDVEKLIHYDYPPVDGIKFQDMYVDKLFLQCIKAVYGDKSIKRDQVNITATESIFDESKTYDALEPTTQKYSNTWETGIDIMAKLTQLDKGLVRSMSFSKDLKFLDKSDYIKQLKDLKDAGGSVEAQNIIDDEIIRLDYSESPFMLKRHRVKQIFMPFSDKTPEDTITILTTLSPFNQYRVLWEFFKEIFTEIELDQGNAEEAKNFYDMKLIEQVTIVDAKVAEFTEALKDEQTTEPVNVVPPEETE